MRTMIVAIGSTGDVAPYLGIARHLADAGHDVTVATHEASRLAAESVGLRVHGLPMDPRALLTEEAAARIRRGGSRAARTVAASFAPWVRPLAAAVDDAADGADLMLLSTLAWTGLYSADARGIPAVRLHLQPLEPTREFAPATSGLGSLGPVANRLLAVAVARAMTGPYLDVADELRARHGLPRWTRRQHRAFLARERPTLHGFSPRVVPRPRDWPAGAEVVGYWTPPPLPQWSPDRALEEFVAAGPPPVYIGFGSTSPAPRDRLGEVVARAIQRAGVRAVVDAGWSDLQLGGDRVHRVAGVDHRWLFPRVAAAVHHGGAGTTGAAVLAGVPSVTVPVALDQPFWARRLHALGVAPAPVPARRLTGEALGAAIVVATSSTSMAEQCRSLGVAVRREDPFGAVLDAVRRLV